MITKTVKRLIEFNLHAQENIATREATARAACRAFNTNLQVVNDWVDAEKRIRCTPEQFGLFIAFRIEEGVKNNRITMLNPVVIDDLEDRIDVSSRGSI